MFVILVSHLMACRLLSMHAMQAFSSLLAINTAVLLALLMQLLQTSAYLWETWRQM